MELISELHLKFRAQNCLPIYSTKRTSNLPHALQYPMQDILNPQNLKNYMLAQEKHSHVMLLFYIEEKKVTDFVLTYIGSID